jgi:hypothetical protein
MSCKRVLSVNVASTAPAVKSTPANATGAMSVANFLLATCRQLEQGNPAISTSPSVQLSGSLLLSLALLQNQPTFAVHCFQGDLQR